MSFDDYYWDTPKDGLQGVEIINAYHKVVAENERLRSEMGSPPSAMLAIKRPKWQITRDGVDSHVWANCTLTPRDLCRFIEGLSRMAWEGLRAETLSSPTHLDSESTL